MAESYVSNKQFTGENFTKKSLPTGEYELCTFTDCDFTKSDVCSSVFYECTFIRCQLSGVNLRKTAFRDVTFTDCQLESLHFEHCNDFLFSARFTGCVLNRSSFYKLKCRETQFTTCTMQEVDFSGTDLTDSSFDDCDLKRAIFANTNLEKVDFRTAFNYALDPEINRLGDAKFAWPGVAALLVKYGISIEA